MNQYDEMSEDLTSMMIVLDGQSDRTGLRPLMKALERAHTEACKASQVLRENSARESETQLKLVRKAKPYGLSTAILGLAALSLATQVRLRIV